MLVVTRLTVLQSKVPVDQHTRRLRGHIHQFHQQPAPDGRHRRLWRMLCQCAYNVEQVNEIVSTGSGRRARTLESRDDGCSWWSESVDASGSADDGHRVLRDFLECNARRDGRAIREARHRRGVSCKVEGVVAWVQSNRILLQSESLLTSRLIAAFLSVTMTRLVTLPSFNLALIDPLTRSLMCRSLLGRQQLSRRSDL